MLRLGRNATQVETHLCVNSLCIGLKHKISFTVCIAVTVVQGFPSYSNCSHTLTHTDFSLTSNQFGVSHHFRQGCVAGILESWAIRPLQLLLFCMKASQTAPKDGCGCVNTPLFTQTGSGLDGHSLPTSGLENFLYQLLQYLKPSCSLAKGQFAKKSEQINCFKERDIL